MDSNEREKFFSGNRALTNPDWLPPANIWPELADLRAEHERLLAVASQEGQALSEVQKRHEEEDAAQGVALKAQFLTGSEPSEDERQSEDVRKTEIADAQLRVEAAYDALVTFLTEAMAEIRHRAPEWYELLQSRWDEAKAKREEAQRLVAEANQLISDAHRMRNWLDRESGVSVLGHIPFSEMGIPAMPEYKPAHFGVPGPEPVDEPEPVEAA